MADDKARQAPAAKIRRVRGPWFAVGGILMALAIAGALYLYGQTASRDQYLALAVDMAHGDVIAREHLGLIGVNADAALPLVPPGEADLVIGQRLVVDARAATPLTFDMVSTGEHVPDGKALVGLNLQAGEYPTPNIGVGDYLAVVAIPDRRDGLAAYEIARAEVLSRTLLTDANMRMFLTVVVDEDRAPALAALSAAGRLHVVQVETLEPGDNQLAGLPFEDLPFDSTGDGLDDRTGQPLPTEPPAEEDDGQDDDVDVADLPGGDS